MITPNAATRSAADRAWHDRGLVPALVLGALLSGCGTTVAAGSTDDLFERYEVVTGEAAQRQTVLSGFFLGGATAQLAVVHVDDDDDRRLRMYGLDNGAWVPVLDATLGPEVLLVDVADIGGRDRLITYETGRLSAFDPESATARELVRVTTTYKPATPEESRMADATQSEVPRVDITRDLNRDGRDDLVLPDIDGFWVSTQLGDGSFTEAAKLGPPEPFLDGTRFDDPRTYGDLAISVLTIPWYLSRVHEMDYDRDGRSDLVFWNQDHFDVHLQDASGRFDPAAETFTTDVPFDADGVYSNIFRFSEGNAFSILFGFRAKTRRTVLHSLRDMNGDGVADLVTQSLEGRGLLRQRSQYEVHLGTPTAGGTAFAREVEAVIRPRGRAGGLQPAGYSSQWLQDFDGDGRVDIMFHDVSVGVGGMLRTMIGKSVPINLEFYRGEEGTDAKRATTRRKIRQFAPFAGRGNVFFPPVLMGDVDGDGRSDLLVGQGPEELNVFLGVPGPSLLARQARKVAVALPYDERSTRLVDLNRTASRISSCFTRPPATRPTSRIG